MIENCMKGLFEGTENYKKVIEKMVQLNSIITQKNLQEQNH